MKNSNDTEKIDMKDEFFAACQELELGQLVGVKKFKLIEAMSSVELMDPKMDTGVKKPVKNLGLANAVKNGLFDGNPTDILATIDATFALMVSWLEGGSLAQTLFTNVMMRELEEVHHEIYTPFCHALTHIVQIVTYVITNSYTYEEEDFQAHCPFPVCSQVPRDEVVRHLREVTATLAQSVSHKPPNSPESRKVLAIGARMEMCCLLIEVITWLVPPQTPAVLKVLSNFKPDEPEEKSEKEEVRITAAGENEVGLTEEEAQPPFTRSESNKQQCQSMARRLETVAQAIAESSKMGRSAPNNGEDGNFSWLSAIEPDLNKRFLPSTFPRKVDIPDRKTALDYLVGLTRRLKIIATNSLDTTQDLISLFFFARSFNFDKSCVLTRSVLQLALFPLDEHISGHPDKSIAEPIEVTLREMFPPAVLDKNSPAHHDPLCQQLYNAFMVQISKHCLSVYQTFGTNLARQRDRIIVSIEDLGLIQRDANRVEYRTSEIIRENSHEAPHQAVHTFVLFNLLSLVSHYFELSLRMDLFVPYEFPYIYWYLSDILARWQISTLERSQEMNLLAWKSNPLSTSVNRRTSKEKQKCEENLKKRFQINQSHTVHQFGMAQIADGIVKTTIALIKMRKIKVPKWAEDSEKQRYDNRMAPMKCLGHPLYISYEQYLILSKTNELYETPIPQLIEEAIEKFDHAIQQLVRLREYPDFHDDETIYIKVARANLIGARLLLRLQNDMTNRRVDWIFGEDCPIYPILRIT
ncbi:unnamed protein product [Caenorhabditis angaria]|uniref:Protein MAK10 homolog n=1 Tax=Caenorhabditis angaria TaxID=860376 RepID=A0A9P1IQR7_9PELO|nr:unnamed protein product [Caenorhabditis angaria]